MEMLIGYLIDQVVSFFWEGIASTQSMGFKI